MKLLKSLFAIVALTFSLYAHADITVFAAASLTNVLDEIIGTFEQETGKKVVASYAASSVLAKQIEAGSPADIFISADLDWMNYLDNRNYIQPKPAILAGNQLVLVAPVDSTLSLTVGKGMNLAAALGSEKIALADPSSVPAGKYARAAFEYYGEWQGLQGKIIPLENVRATLVVVEENEAPLGVVYATDAKISTKVKVVGVFPEESHAPIVYPAGLVKENLDADSESFFSYLQSAKAKDIFAKFGFGAVTK